MSQKPGISKKGEKLPKYLILLINGHVHARTTSVVGFSWDWAFIWISVIFLANSKICILKGLSVFSPNSCRNIWGCLLEALMKNLHLFINRFLGFDENLNTLTNALRNACAKFIIRKRKEMWMSQCLRYATHLRNEFREITNMYPQRIHWRPGM